MKRTYENIYMCLHVSKVANQKLDDSAIERTNNVAVNLNGVVRKCLKPPY